jgi:hypothetical protein
MMNADAPINQSREAHRSARPHHSPEEAMYSEALPNPAPTVDLKATRRS